MGSLKTIDLLVFLVYFVVVAFYGYWIYSKKKKAAVSASHDYFLAEGSLTWWAIGASLIASNISAEQFIGMSGNGFFVGTAVAAYEWIAALALIIIAVWFMPVYLKNRIYTMPQFLKTRYNETVSLIMAIFWLLLYVFVNLTAILYLGAIAISGLIGPEYLHTVMLGLAVFALIITLGGMKVIGYTDVIQVAVLIIGGFATIYYALTIVSEKFGLGRDAIAGFQTLMEKAPDHFKMILPQAYGCFIATGCKQVSYSSRHCHVFRGAMDCEFELLGLQPIHHATCFGCRPANCPQRHFVCRYAEADDARDCDASGHCRLRVARERRAYKRDAWRQWTREPGSGLFRHLKLSTEWFKRFIYCCINGRYRGFAGG